ncbi:hypothetical protein FGADI_9147 [Fusarium gaditjirri]|uniref:Uncharacterized protein n=1 Tax=Fusarium gaditjirri TaxID=282569 RepID=A0A8H4T0N6_9HYPO|nr:hypothetical protein FGADI_9147 [Fusarium gaditjirri]
MAVHPDPVPTDVSEAASKRLVDNCLHFPKTGESQLYCKGQFRVNQQDFIFLAQNIGYQLTHSHPCKLCNRDEPPLRFFLPKDDFGDGMHDLFKWYGIPVKRIDMRAEDEGPKGLKLTTGKITQIFDNPPESTGPALFSKMRHFMDAQTLNINQGPADGNLMERYFYPSWAGKYWLNRYLQLTKQRAKLHKYRHLEPEEQQHIKLKLPKMADVTRLVIIHVRASAKSGVGRIMDKTTLKHVSSSIAKANELVSKWDNRSDAGEETEFVPARRFSHIILYGDFDYFGGLEQKTWVEEEINDPEVEVLFISRPWESKKETRKSAPIKKDMTAEREDEGRINDEVNRLWSRSRKISEEGIPLQVKILGIWTALCKRYNPRACVIGHRSGFVEASGLIGLPTFYLNDEREDIDKRGIKKTGELLWAPFQNASRLRELSDVMNTIIPVEALKKQPKTSNSSNAKVEALKIAPGHEQELTAALFMFMCCNIDTSPGTRYKSSPAWTARVAMRKSESGRSWLLEKYLFAVRKSEDVGGKKWSEMDFVPWLEEIEKIWDYEWDLRRLGGGSWF